MPEFKKRLHLILLHPERSKLYTILAFVSAIGLSFTKCMLMYDGTPCNENATENCNFYICIPPK